MHGTVVRNLIYYHVEGSGYEYNRNPYAIGARIGNGSIRISSKPMENVGQIIEKSVKPRLRLIRLLTQLVTDFVCFVVM